MESTTATSHRPPAVDRDAPARVVLVGCRFGGLFVACALKRAAVDVLVIDRNHYHLFQPLPYQVASAALGPADIAQPIRRILHDQGNAYVWMAEVAGIDLGRRSLLADGRHVPYDYLVRSPRMEPIRTRHEGDRRCH